MYNQIIPEGIFTNDDTFDRYHLGVFFRDYVLQKEYYPYQFNGWQNKKFYGILDNKKNVIYPKLFGLKSYISRGNLHKNLSFVVDAFEELRNFYSNLVTQGSVSSNSIYTNLDVHKSTENPIDYYNKYLNDVFNIFNNIYIDETIKNSIKDFNSFIPHFIRFLRIILKSYVINRSVYFRSGLVPSSINGLRISLANINNTIDVKVKSNIFMNTPEFNTFVDISSKFGFFLDKNEPWTIVADLESAAMKKYIKNYNIFDTDNLFLSFYYRAYSVDLDSLKNVLIGFWNSYISNIAISSTVEELKNCKNLFISNSTLKPIDLELFDNYFNINWQLRLYFYIRILEDKVKITQNKFETLWQESCKVNKVFDTEKAVQYINEKVTEIIQLSQPEVNPLTNPDAIYTLLTSRTINLPGEDINF